MVIWFQTTINQFNFEIFQDLASVKRGDQNLEKFDAMVLFGSEEEEFAEHMVERLEQIGMKIFYHPRDLRLGMYEHAAKSEVIGDRCNQVQFEIFLNF